MVVVEATLTGGWRSFVPGPVSVGSCRRPRPPEHKSGRVRLPRALLTLTVNLLLAHRLDLCSPSLGWPAVQASLDAIFVEPQGGPLYDYLYQLR